jgi:hypothetical protein
MIWVVVLGAFWLGGLLGFSLMAVLAASGIWENGKTQ